VGLRSLSIELRETEIDALIDSGFLEETHRDDPHAVTAALYEFFDRILIE
jgi:hypothetical protein